ncbi:hypothetical protein JHK87_018347 [Glycine soja]|nr:hypothetical protein JHK87_018347 [Glycine soja]
MSHNVDDDELVSEMEEAPTFASSIPVPNVQEMVMNDPLQPERYVRSQEDFEKVNHMPQLSSEVPVIDLAPLLRGNKEELLKLDIVNHGIQKELLQGIKNAAYEFFKLPTEEKNKYAMASNDIHGQAYVVSEEQTLDWEIIEAYATEVRRVGEELLSSLSMIMGMQKHVFLGLHKESL